MRTANHSVLRVRCPIIIINRLTDTLPFKSIFIYSICSQAKRLIVWSPAEIKTANSRISNGISGFAGCRNRSRHKIRLIYYRIPVWCACARVSRWQWALAVSPSVCVLRVKHLKNANEHTHHMSAAMPMNENIVEHPIEEGMQHSAHVRQERWREKKQKSLPRVVQVID